MTGAHELRPADMEIIRLLQQDARMTNRALAEAVGLAPSTCLERVRALRHAGIIRGASLRVDPAALGRPVAAFLAIRLQPHRRELVGPFVDHVLGQPETRAIYHLTGPNDYLVHVTATSVPDLQRLVLDELTARPEVGHVQTMLIFQAWEGGPVLPPQPSPRSRPDDRDEPARRSSLGGQANFGSGR
jgi:DNA-binding Lrp family transcriptional regulator